MASGYSKPYFAIIPILLNLIAIVVATLAYTYMNTRGMFPAYITYIYWVVNIIISYNILISSVRSVIIPLLTAAVGSAGLYSYLSTTALPYVSALTFAQCWQLAILGVIGLLICISIRLQ